MAVIIYPPAVDWHEAVPRIRSLALQFAGNGHIVFFCNLHQKAFPSLEKIRDNLYVVYHFAEFMQTLIPGFKFGKAPTILWCPQPINKYPLHLLQSDKIIYDCTADTALTQQMLDEADIVFCSSDHLMIQMMLRDSNKQIYCLFNGWDPENILGAREGPIKLAKKRSSRLPTASGLNIGCLGDWGEWVDVELVEKTCNMFPEHNVIAVGNRVGQRLPNGTSNFTLIEPADSRTFGEYLAHFDLCVIPFRVNQKTAAMHPGEVYCCLAAGKTVIATALPDLEVMQPMVTIGSNHEMFLKHVGTALHTNCENIKEKAAFAGRNTWAERYASIEHILSKSIPGFHEMPELMNFAEETASQIENVLFVLPESDATINNNHPYMNLDTDPVFIGMIEHSIYRYLVRFDLTGIVPPVRKAILTLFAGNDNREYFNMIKALAVLNSWDEKLVTWATRPFVGAYGMTSGHFDEKTSRLEWEITSLVNEWLAGRSSNFGILLKQEREQDSSLFRGLNRHTDISRGPKLKLYV